MIKKFNKIFSTLVLSVTVICLFTLTVFAASTAENSEHKLTLTLPEEYVLLSNETAEENTELLESLGYSESAFKNYLKQVDNTQILFLGVNPDNMAQVTVKASSTDFSKKVTDFSLLTDEALQKTANDLVQVKGARHKMATVNGIKLIEVSATDKDSGGEFCSIQYLTVRNGILYTVGYTFNGAVNDSKVNTAWGSVQSLNIKDVTTSSAFDLGTILLMFLLSAVVIAGVVVVGLIGYTFVRDIKNKKLAPNEETMYIRRKK
ncbi:MAG: hypothetical protein IIW03_00490 [Clostridia bacterium]|nr:hypothetical protein [Clostridia bacterium]